MTRLLVPPYWPVSWERMGARFEFAEFATEPIRVGTLRVRGCPVPHPGGCLAYRVDDGDGGASLVFATDLEWRGRTDAYETAFMAICGQPRPADVLIIDAHFARANEEAFVGWGHSCWEDGLEIAESAGIKQVLLGHHAPEADDKALGALERQVKKRAPGAMLARAGQGLRIGS